jgi:hypothetical protein
MKDNLYWIKRSVKMHGEQRKQGHQRKKKLRETMS